MKFTHQLPPLSQLAHFETAARCGSFKQAALEHNVTPSAVSHQIRKLEQDLGTALFERSGSSVTLTEAGEALFDVLHGGFARILHVVRDLRSPHPAEVVRIAAPSAFAACWLAPLIAEFAGMESQITVETVPIDGAHPSEKSQSADLRIVYGQPGDDAETTITKLFDDVLLPLCEPSSYLIGTNPSLEDMAAAALIHTDTDCLLASDWRMWFRHLGYEGPIGPSGPRVTTALSALEVAQQGLGIMLGWEKMQEAHLLSGRLTRAASFTVPSPQAFYLGQTKAMEAKEPVRVVSEWIISQAKISSLSEHY